MSKQVVVELRVSEDLCKRLKDPVDAQAFHMEAFLPFSEAVKLPRGNANVRPPSTSKPAYKEMQRTVEDSPRSFHVKNRGITYFCEKFQYDNATKSLRVVLPIVLPNDDEPKFGIADGGHTFAVIEDTIARSAEFADREDWREPYVRIHFVAGDYNKIAPDDEIVEALNTSSQVQAYTLDDYSGQFDELKEALAKSGFDTSLVAFRENEDKPWNAVELVQRLACFLKDKWTTTPPTFIYRSKGKTLDLYRDDKTRGEFRKLYDVIRDVITLPEFIEAAFAKGDIVPLASFGRLRVVKKQKKAASRPGTEYRTDRKVDLSALLPMAAAFRELLILKGDRYVWRLPPKEVFAGCGEKLYQVMSNRLAKVGSVSELGSDSDYWQSCVTIVLRQKDKLIDTSFSATA